MSEINKAQSRMVDVDGQLLVQERARMKYHTADSIFTLSNNQSNSYTSHYMANKYLEINVELNTHLLHAQLDTDKIASSTKLVNRY